MIVTPRIAVRLALIVIATVILQVSFFSYLSILGATPYVVPVVIVALGLLGGGVVGAVCGFAAGLLIDSLLLQTLGVSSLVLLSIGYLAGRYREGFEISNLTVPALLSGGFTLLAATGFAAIELMLGVDAPVSLLVVREILVQALLAIGLGFGVYPLLRRVLAPALIDYQPTERTSVVSRLRRRPARRSRTVEHSARTPRAARRRSPLHTGAGP
jgi:rod shape-determining protein MreD